MKINKQKLINEVEKLLRRSMSSDYSMTIASNDEFINAIQENIETTSIREDESYYNEDDICLAIGRVLINKFIS